MTNGIEWILARGSTFFPFIGGTNIQLVKAEAGGKRVTVYYIDEGNKVRLLDIMEE